MALEAGSAVDGTGLSGLMAAKFKSFDKTFNIHLPNANWMFDSMAQAIVEYIKANAEVATTVSTTVGTEMSSLVTATVYPNPAPSPGDSLAGVVSDGSAEGTGTGSGIGTIV